MPEENDQHANVAEDKPKRRRGGNGKVQQLHPGQQEKPKTREQRPPAEAPRTWPAADVEAIAENLIHDSGYPHMSVLRGARIAYLFSNAEREGDMDVAKAQRFSSTYSFLYPDGGVPQFVLRVSKPQWDRIPDDLRIQCAYHYLLRFGTDENGRWRIERPDVVGFLAELNQFKGLAQRWNAGVERARQLGLFDSVASTELARASEQPIATPAH